MNKTIKIQTHRLTSHPNIAPSQGKENIAEQQSNQQADDINENHSSSF